MSLNVFYRFYLILHENQNSVFELCRPSNRAQFSILNALLKRGNINFNIEVLL